MGEDDCDDRRRDKKAFPFTDNESAIRTGISMTARLFGVGRWRQAELAARAEKNTR
jgi:hypothetical protein